MTLELALNVPAAPGDVRSVVSTTKTPALGAPADDAPRQAETDQSDLVRHFFPEVWLFEDFQLG